MKKKETYLSRIQARQLPIYQVKKIFFQLLNINLDVTKWLKKFCNKNPKRLIKTYSLNKTFIELVKEIEEEFLDEAFINFINEYADTENDDNRTLPEAAGISDQDFTAVIDNKMSIKELIIKYEKKG